MGSIKYLASKKDLEFLLENYPEKIEYFVKADTFIGSSESIDFINKKIKEYNDKK